MSPRLVATLLLASAAIQGQVGPLSSETTQLSTTGIQAVPLPAGPTPVQTNVVVDTSTAGGDLIDAAIGDPNVVISLVTPAGTEITAANAQNAGYTFYTYTADGGEYAMISSPLTMGGTHTLIQFPPGQASGTYQIKANTSAASADTGMILTYPRSADSSVPAVMAGRVRPGVCWRSCERETEVRSDSGCSLQRDDPAPSARSVEDLRFELNVMDRRADDHCVKGVDRSSGPGDLLFRRTTSSLCCRSVDRPT
jgi:hypothetical protein